jgi:hypothetical protein
MPVLDVNLPQRFVRTNGVLIVFGEHNRFGVSVTDRGPQRVILVEVDWRGKPYKREVFSSYSIYNDALDVDLDECMVRVKEGDVVLAELGTQPHGHLHQPWMVWPGDQEYETDNGVTIPPALRIVDEKGALWTLGFETAPKELSPDGEFAFDVLRDGVAIPGAVASRIEYRNGQVRIFTCKGWRRWLGRAFS